MLKELSENLFSEISNEQRRVKRISTNFQSDALNISLLTLRLKHMVWLLEVKKVLSFASGPNQYVSS